MWQTTIEDHYRANWKAVPEICEFSAGPIHELPDGFSVLKFRPQDSRNMWTYATRCMSSPADSKAVELHIFCPLESKEVVELLVAVAHFHRTSTKLDIGHTVNFGRPWVSGSESDYGLVSLPYLDGPQLEVLSFGARSVNFYWLIPITSAELSFKKKNGVNALEDEFERSGFSYADPFRKSVV